MARGDVAGKSGAQMPDKGSARATAAGPSNPDNATKQVLATLRNGVDCADQCRVLLTLADAARVLQISADDLVHLMRTGQLTSVVIAGQELVPVRELVELIEDYTAIAKRSTR